MPLGPGTDWEKPEFGPKLKGSINLLWQPATWGKHSDSLALNLDWKEGEMREHTDEQSFGTKAGRKKRAKKFFPFCPFRMVSLLPFINLCFPLQCL